MLRLPRCALVTRILGPSVKSTWISAALHPGIRDQVAWNSWTKQRNLYHHSFFGFLLGWLSTSLSMKTHFSPNLHPDCVFVILCHTEGCQKITWRIRTSPVKVDISFQRDHDLWEIFLSKNFFCHSVSAVLRQERTFCVPFPRFLSSWRMYTVLSLSTDSILIVSRSSSLYQYSYSNCFVSGFSKYRVLIFWSICLFQHNFW